MQAEKLIAACLQLNSSQRVADNLQKVLSYSLQAVQQGAQWIVLPENAFCHPYDRKYQHELDELLEQLTIFCMQHKVWMFAGTIPVCAPVSGEDGSGRVYSALHVINDQGAVQAVYHKLHLFDVHVADEGTSYRESDAFVAGQQAVVVQTPWGNVGLAVCYDLRFPELFLAMEPHEPLVHVVPAAFTLHTGQKHWHALLSARALDTFSYMLAANQTGAHTDRHGSERRSTYGHSAIVDPDGKVLAELAAGEGLICVELDTERGRKLRCDIPVGHHRRSGISALLM